MAIELGYYSALLLKVLAILSKLVFLLVISIEFQQGVLAEYLFYISIIVTAATIFGLSMSDHLAVIVGRYKSLYSFFFNRYYIKSNLIIIGGYFLSILFFHDLNAMVFFSMVFIVQSIYLGGVVRARSFLSFEMLLNFPNIVFLLILFFIDTYNITNVITAYSFSFFLSNNIVLIFNLKKYFELNDKYKNIYGEIEVKAIDFYHGFKKMLIDLMFFLSSRFVVVVPPIFGYKILTDDNSFAYVVAESATLLIFVYINKRFVYYLNNKQTNVDRCIKDLYFILFVSILLLSIPADIILSIHLLKDVYMKFGVDYNTVIFGKEVFIILASYSCLSLVKYFLWSKNGNITNVFQYAFMTILLFSICFMLFFDIFDQFMLFSLLNAVLVLIWIYVLLGPYYNKTFEHKNMIHK